MQELEAHDSLSDRQNDICGPANGVDPVVARTLGIYSGAAVVARLPLPVADHSQLQQCVHVLLQWKNLRKRVVQVEILSGVNIASFLRGMEFVHLIRRERRRFVLGQVEGFARGRGIGPMAAAGVVASTSSEPPSWCEEGVGHQSS